MYVLSSIETASCTVLHEVRHIMWDTINHSTMLYYFACVLGSYHWPADVVQAEGLDATFLCQHPTNSGSI